MKKSRYLASFLSLALSLTPLTAIPVNAAETDPSPAVTTAVLSQAAEKYTETTSGTFPLLQTTKTAIIQTTTSAPKTIPTTTSASAVLPKDPDEYAEKTLKVTVACVDIDTGEYVGGMSGVLARDQGYKPTFIENFKFENKPSELTPYTFDLKKGEYEQFHVAAGPAPLGYQIVDDKSVIEFSVYESIDPIAECVFYVRKLAPNASPEIAAAPEGKFFFRSCITSNKDKKPVENIDMMLVKYMEKGGEPEVIEKWNTSDDPIHYTNIYDCDPEAWGYALTSEKLPDYYCQGWDSDHIMLTYDFGLQGMYNASLTLNKYENPMPEFPVKTDRETVIKIKEFYTGESMKGGFDITLNKIDKDGKTVSKIGHWDKDKTEYSVVIPCEYKTLEDHDDFKIEIVGLPDGCELMNKDTFSLRGFDYAFDYRENIHDKPTEYTLIVKNENIDPALRAPVYHTEPVTYPELTTTVTTLPLEDITDKTSDLKGDANCSGNVDISDAVLIMQTISNPAKYKLTEQGKKNADITGDGVTNSDALAIQKKLLGLKNTDEIKYSKTIDWYMNNLPSGVHDICVGNGRHAVITSTDELKEYIAQVAPKEKAASYPEKYNDSFFNDNVLLINSVDQGGGTSAGYEFDSVNFSDKEINISLKSTQKPDEPVAAVMSLCIAQVTVPKTSYTGQTVNWSFTK